MPPPLVFLPTPGSFVWLLQSRPTHVEVKGEAMKTQLSRIAVGVAALFAATSVPAQTTGDVSLSLDLTGSMAVLSFYSTVNVEIPLDTLFVPTGCTAGTGDHYSCDEGVGTPDPTVATLNGANLEANFDDVPPPTFPVTLTNTPLILQDVWSVSSIGGDANSTLTVALAATPTTLQGPGASTINLIAAALQSTGATGNDTATITFPDPGLVTPRVGDVRINLDFTNTVQSGLHTRASFEYTLTLTNT
jgi:hypothetical protein